jgi:hypothetical protein
MNPQKGQDCMGQFMATFEKLLIIDFAVAFRANSLPNTYFLYQRQHMA